MTGEFSRDFSVRRMATCAAYNVFTRRDGTIRHFWGDEMGGATADPGQDPRGAPDLIRCGRCSTPRRKVAVRIGIRS